MKRIGLLVCFLALVVSCKSGSSSAEKPPKPASTSASNAVKLDTKAEKNLNGNWKIVKVDFPGSGYIKVNAFGIADPKCFEGSTWTFVQNNNTGTVTLNQSGCPSFTSAIKWQVSKEGQFGLKFISEGTKAKNQTQGYYSKFQNATEQSFELADVIDVAGQKKNVTYYFQRN